jgi:eukaryotic-like serine/threonine-protein kinase
MQGRALDAPLVVDDSADDIPAIGACVASRYVVEEVIGSGGMSVVVRARDLRLDAPVALKILRRSRAVGSAQLARFVREARIVARLRSDHVVRILDVDAASQPPYLAMDLVPEGDVGRLLSTKGRLPVPLALAIVLQACRGVADAHASDIVHRDLKPSNLLLARTSKGAMRIKVADFGISKTMEQGLGPDLTSSGQIVGSPRYMSPEQVRGGGGIDARSDVWALGAILYELISGLAPFDAETVPDTLARIVSETATPLEGEDVPPRLSAVVAMCLQKDPALRPPSVTALAQELETIEVRTLGAAETAAMTDESGTSGRPWSRSISAWPRGKTQRAGGWALASVIAFAAGIGLGGMRARRGAASDAEGPANAHDAAPSVLLARLDPPEPRLGAPSLADAAPLDLAAPAVARAAPNPAASVPGGSERHRGRPRVVHEEAGVDDLELDRHD